MNRSILIVLCDFLLVSLVAFSNFEDNRLEREDEVIDPTPATSPRETVAKEMVSALKMALDEERQSRERLAQELEKTRESTLDQQALLAERDRKIQEFQESLTSTADQARRLAQERAALQQQISSAQTNVEHLQTAVSATRSEANLSREQLQSLQDDLRRRQQEAEALRQHLAQLERAHSNALTAKQELDAKLQVAEAEKRLAAQELSNMREEVKTVRTEKQQIHEENQQLHANTSKLAEGVTVLATKSGELSEGVTALTARSAEITEGVTALRARSTEITEGVTALATQSAELRQEIKENRPLAPNTIFSEFARNRVDTYFSSSRAGAFGQEVRREKNSQTVLISDGPQTYAIYHIADTPLTLWPPGTEWLSLGGTISRGTFSYPIARVSFLAQDPRIAVVPLDPAQAQKLGGKVYQIAPDPFKFQEAVLVGATEGYYGECSFRIDVSTPQHVRMDRSLFRGLFGKFNPSRGDLVLSKTGELLGIMVNNEYCAVLSGITPTVTLQCGDNLKAQQAGQSLTQLQNRVAELPIKLQ